MIEWAEDVDYTCAAIILSRQPMAVPVLYGEKFLRDALAPDCRDSLLCMGRNQGRNHGTRHCNTRLYSVTWSGQAKAAFGMALVRWRLHVRETSRASLGGRFKTISLRRRRLKHIRILEAIRVRRSLRRAIGSVDVLSADRNAAIARGADLVLL